MNKGIYFAIATALISGFSIFLNKFAIKEFPSPLFFTTAKNFVVGIMLFALVWKKNFLPKKFEIKLWVKMIIIGAIGGSIPFLLFFHGLSQTSAGMAAFIHKTLFLWVSVLAFFFLKERLSKFQAYALLLLFAGMIYLEGPKGIGFNKAEWFIFGATLIWAMETILVKKFVKDISPALLAFGRLFFGSFMMIGYLLITKSLPSYQLPATSYQLSWLLFTSILLFGYVLTWYYSLKYAPAGIVSSVLVLGAPVTALLEVIFVVHRYALTQIMGSMVIVIGLLLILLPSFYDFKKTVKIY